KEFTIPYNAETGYYEATFDTTIYDDGNYNISAEIFDFSKKNITTEKIFFKIDNNPPDVKWLSPISGSYVSGEIRIEAKIEDKFLSSAMYTVDESGWYELDKKINTSLISDGEHEITIRAIDERGQITKSKIMVLVDNIAPEVMIVSPKNRAHISSNEKLVVYASGGVSKVLVSIDNGSYTEIYRPAPERPYEYNLDNYAFATGNHTIKVKSIDFAGHENWASIEIFVDIDAPKIEVVKPKKRAESGKVEFLIHVVDDSNVGEVFLNIDGKLIEMLDVGDGLYSYSWKTSEDDNGVYRYHYKVKDTLGNVNITSGVVEIENSPDYWKTTLESLPLIFFIFVVCLVISIVVLLKTGKISSWLGKERKVCKKKKFLKKGEKIDAKLNFRTNEATSDSLIDSIKEIRVEGEVLSDGKR
ncbi:MAG: Ig-like domain-containing protein, partial [Candidatus Thermoplasmatota archaeon]